MGIGGLDKQFEIIFRRAFSSRLIPDKVLKIWELIILEV